METTHCPLCGTDNHEVVLRGRDLLHGLPGCFQVVQCKNCSLRFTNPRPTAEYMQRYYPDDYAPHLGLPDRSSRRGFLNRNIRRAVQAFLGTDSTPVPSDGPNLRVLDLGCGNGAFLHTLQGRDWALYGLEPSVSAAEYARDRFGLNVVNSTIEEYKLERGFFDIVYCRMVLEHLYYPRDVLCEIRGALKSSGHLVVTVPNAGSWEWKTFREYWYGLQVPRHLSHFTPETLTRLLNESGYSVERIVFQPSLTNVLVSVGLWLRSVDALPGMVQFLCTYPRSSSALAVAARCAIHPPALLLSQLRQSGRIAAVARPIS